MRTHPDDAYMQGVADGRSNAEFEYKPWVEELTESLKQVKVLLAELVDPDDCWFDHHGGCQAHGYLSLEQGEKCPHFEAKELLGW
jgi:hypothetical protein